MTNSTIPAVLAALETRWIRDLSEDTQVIYGPRATVTVTKQRILTIGAVDFTIAPATFATTFGDLDEDEAYDIACVYEHVVSGTDQHTATVGALDGFNRARASLQADAPNETLGVAGVQWIRIGGRGRVLPAGDERTIKEGRGCAIPFTVNVMGVL